MHSKTPSHVSVLLFDLGGVLIDYGGVEALHALTDARYSVAEIRQRWPESPALQSLDTGSCSPQEFARKFVAEWGLTVAPDAFLQQFAGWLGTPYAGAIELLEALQGRYLLACLSNINVVYWERQVTHTGLRASFDRCYASHEIGCLKPDPRSYAHVVSDLGVRPDAVVFFDDTERNVEAAVSMGMQAYRVQGPSEAKTVLRQLALL